MIGTVPMNSLNQQLDMGLESDLRVTVSPPRPTTLDITISRPPASDKVDIDWKTASENAKRNRKKKKRKASENVCKSFNDLYVPTGQNLGEGATGIVFGYRNTLTGKEYAVKVVRPQDSKTRHKILKEVELFHHCAGHPHILQMIEYFEEEGVFYLVFEKMHGGTLLENIQRRGHLTEQEASVVVREIAQALHYMHNKGIAHRDLKPENVLCEIAGQLVPLRICDFDLASGAVLSERQGSEDSPVTTPDMLTPVGSAEFMAPEVVDVWQDQAWSYDKKCDLWSLGIICYIILCGYAPFYGECEEDCGWEQGEPCHNCQEDLFLNIQSGNFNHDAVEWKNISDDAQSLIKNLLVRDPHQRYSAQQVLKHPWVSKESSRIQLATPRVLLRNNSIKELEAFAENAVAVNRMILRHLSISEAYQPPVATFKIGGDSEEEEETAKSEQESEDSPPNWIGLSPPGGSSLARRRFHSRQKSDENSNSIPITRGPPKVTSAIF